MLPLTTFYAALLGLLFLALSVAVSMGRARYRAHHGDAGQPRLQRLIRIQANFAEYVPLTLLLIGLNEAAGTAPALVRALLLALLVARLMHPFGMLAPEASPAQFALRAPAILANWAILLLAALLLLA
ncbi:MAPEG family protein [Roseomonas sp. GC11]|uniref:MAPEG family protein n=1 Tax=Roseomonas sp. GC11 TaxID=2950546 RepID=UPI00210DC6E5|nr:MAPEG family protein [Roseomonas sp. GC11]MCQ4161240.1 MAPEG family protein [Roseomonas sp. GC11]